MSQLKVLEDENRRLKRMFADLDMQADLLQEALGKSDAASSAPRAGREGGGDEGKPLVIRVDNGPEYASPTLMIRAGRQGIALTCIQPGKPPQYAYVERYNRTVHHDWRDLCIFETIEEVRQIATEWL